MSERSAVEWTFLPRFRRRAFGWRSEPAITRIDEAVKEIRAVARKDPARAGDGAVLLLERISAALEQVDSSSGAIGSAVNDAVEELAGIIARAVVSHEVRERWLEKLWEAVEDDEIPYIELLPDYWGEMCVTPERASIWADRLLGPLRLSWDRTKRSHHDYFKGTTACLSCLLAAGRFDELLHTLTLAPYKWWHYTRWGAKALVKMGRKEEALRYAENERELNDNPLLIAEFCEAILLADGMAEEAYARYAIEANRKSTYLATFRALARKYPHKAPRELLKDLVHTTPGEESKWFAAAKSVGLLEEAVALANLTPCDPRTLTRAARDMAVKEPWFAVEAGMAALRWLTEGFGYEITGLDVRDAYKQTMAAAENGGSRAEVYERIRLLVAGETSPDRFVTKVLAGELGLPDPPEPSCKRRPPR